MKRFKILLAILAVPLIGLSQGTLVEDTIILHLTISDLQDILAQNGLPSGVVPTDYEVDVHRVIYNTPDVDGTPTTASGLICLPVGDTCAMPMMAYLHGTKLKKHDTFYYLNGEWNLGAITATTGYAMCMPDYLGLGAGPGIHPYQHAHSEATASVDILRSCRMICQEQGLQLNDQLFLIGYSQGGHSVLATHRMIQEELSNEFVVTASAPGSGPYDMSGAQLDMVAAFQPYSVPGYLPFVIQSYQHVYGNLYDSIQQIYIPPYDQTLTPLLDGSHSMDEVNAAMPAIPREIIQPDYADAFFSDTTNPAFMALRANDVYEWIPQAPVLFNYCGGDEEVSILNTIIASDWMENHGAPSIDVEERDTALGHFQCATPSILFSKVWFDTMADLCQGNVGVREVPESPATKVYPNPVSDGIVRFDNRKTMYVRLIDGTGRQVISQQRINPNGSLDVGEVSAGIYLLELTENDQRSVLRLVVQ
ncbi:MAG: T9SS type A sorting domain-containing protein [Flavobacteriales bacterium]|nr:T9SS type A sorting domain-containing protein [Flavobacteriales bacterium]